MALHIAKTTLLTVTFADTLEEVSLLQMQASAVRTHGIKTSLPDPEHKSSILGNTDGSNRMVATKSDHDFKCNGGNGNWVWVNERPTRNDKKNSVDLTDKTANIQKVWCRDTSMFPGEEKWGGKRCHVLKEVNDPVTGWSTPTFTEHGSVRDEKDCFARARISYDCNHWSEDLRYEMNPLDNLGLWYKPSEWGPDVNGTCYCGKFGYAGNSGELHVTKYETAKGFWFCQLSAKDFDGVDENTPTDLSPETTTATTTTTTTTTTTEVEVCDAGLGVKRGTACPAGSVLAGTQRLCELAAQSAGFKFIGARPTDEKKSHFRPCGCWYNVKRKKAFFNAFKPCADSGGQNKARDAKQAAPLCCKL